MRFIFRFLPIVMGLLALPSSSVALDSHPAMRWGAGGHRIIARVAALQLTDETRREVRRILNGRSLAEVSAWADGILKDRPATAPWHYVNIPIWQATYRAEHCPRQACVIAALEAQEAILADRSRSGTEREEALKWVVHLVGDLHMPLHVGDRGDRGGNDVKLEFAGRTTNLHSLWDSGLLNATGRNEEWFVSSFRDQLRKRGDLKVMSSGSVTDWAMESHAAARDVAYGFLPQSLVVGDDYLGIARPVIEDRLLRASVRLAAVLERTLAGN